MSRGLSCEKASMNWAVDQSTPNKLTVYGGGNGTSGNNYIIFDIRDGIKIPAEIVRYRKITLQRLCIKGYIRSSADWFMSYGFYYIKESGSISDARQFMDKYFLPNLDNNLYTIFKERDGREEVLHFASAEEGGDGLVLNFDGDVSSKNIVVKDLGETELNAFIGVIIQSDVSQNQSYNIGVTADFELET